MKPFRLTAEELVEKDIQKACMDLLKVRGYKTYRLHAGKFRTMDNRVLTGAALGTPDWIAAHGIHRALLVELKRPRGKAKPHQEKEIEELRRWFGLSVVVVDSARALAEFLTRHERSP